MRGEERWCDKPQQGAPHTHRGPADSRAGGGALSATDLSGN